MAEGLSTDGLTGQTTRLAHRHAHEHGQHRTDSSCRRKAIDGEAFAAGDIAHGETHKKTPAAADGCRCFF
jgi:hypothetical protein